MYMYDPWTRTKGRGSWREWGYWAKGDKGEKKEWDNCNSIINKIYLKIKFI